jgi:hypothetical protein
MILPYIMYAISRIRYGEKLNIEYTWGNNYKENILYFFFQMVRSTELYDLEYKLHYLLENIISSSSEFILLYKMIAHTRDIKNGKGEYKLAYMQLLVWYQHYPELAKFALTQFVQGEKYGSWKDIKYFSEYIYHKTGNQNHDFIQYACHLLIIQLNNDKERFLKGKTISLAAKWAPREKSRFRWLYRRIALGVFPEFLPTAITYHSKIKSICKAKIHLRKLLTKMNKYLQTTETFMCSESWRNIPFKQISAKTLYKYNQAFQNKTTDDKIRSTNHDRFIAMGNFQYFLDNPPHIIKGARNINVGELVKAAFHAKTPTDITVINQLWESNKKKNIPLKNLISLVDVSSSMEQNNCEPLYNAIGLGIRVSEKCMGAFKNRMLIYSSNPSWLQFDEAQTFVDKVVMIRDSLRGLNSNLYGAVKMLIEALDKTKSDFRGITLAIFSDMQVDSVGNLYETITQMFKKTNYTPPKILLWNVRKTQSVPVLNRSKIFLLSGYNASLLNVLTQSGLKHCEHNEAAIILHKLLNRNRYKILENKIKSIIK